MSLWTNPVTLFLIYLSLIFQFVPVVCGGCSVVNLNTVQADGVDVFYRSAGPSTAPVILLLHGFPSSSFQFRNLIPLLSDRYRLIAPDLPGYGFTTVPEDRKYNYTFDSIATTTEAFVDALGLEKYAIYLFDYGAPTGFRLATRRPSQITAIISQNGNAYIEGLGQTFWAPIEKYWNASSTFDPSLSSPEAQTLLGLLTFNVTKSQYTTGVPPASLPRIDPAAYTLDATLLQRPGQNIVQLSFFYYYQTNVALYPEWQAYLRKYQPKLLALWGENDVIFVKAGAEAFKRDLPNAEIGFVDTGHFALETNVETYAKRIDGFLSKVL